MRARERAGKRRAERKIPDRGAGNKQARWRAAAAANTRKAKKLKAATAVTDALRRARARRPRRRWRSGARRDRARPRRASTSSARRCGASPLDPRERGLGARADARRAARAAAAREPYRPPAFPRARAACRPVFEDAHVGRTYVNAAGTAVVVLFGARGGRRRARKLIGARQPRQRATGPCRPLSDLLVGERDAGARTAPAPGAAAVNRLRPASEPRDRDLARVRTRERDSRGLRLRIRPSAAQPSR